ncbi:MAG: hypothetical protein ACI37Q_06110 [Candidatus Gastranaerophilaceae bacterium]
MIGAVQNIISNPTLYNMTQSTITQITTETCLKAVGRPSFILMDKDIDAQTKKYSSVKEFLYQMTCLGIYLAAVMPLLKKCSFKLAGKLSNEDVFKAFKSSGEFLKYHKMDEAGKIAKLEEINRNLPSGDRFIKENIDENLAKGVVEISSIIGSVTGLAIIAPIASHPLIHPIMKVMGLDKKSSDKPQEIKK